MKSTRETEKEIKQKFVVSTSKLNAVVVILVSLKLKMIEGDKNLLRATLSRGWLVTQSKLIKLYTVVLHSLASQAAFAAGCAFIGIAELKMPKAAIQWWTGLNFVYDFFIHLSLCLGIFASTQAAIVVIYGPAISLRGEDGDCVVKVATELRRQILKVMTIGALALLSLYGALIANYWAKIPVDQAATTTVFFVFGIVITTSEGIRAYNLFHPGSEFSILHLLTNQRKEDNRLQKYQQVLAGAYDDIPTTGGNGNGVGGNGGGSGRGTSSPSGIKGLDVQYDSSSELDPALMAMIEERKKLQKVFISFVFIFFH